MMFQQRAAYTALAERLATVDLELLIGAPSNLARLPGAYLNSTLVEVSGSQLVARLRPTLTLAVKLQDNSAAEWAIVDLVDRVCTALLAARLSDVCRCAIEDVTYDLREVAGVQHRVADVRLILSQL